MVDFFLLWFHSVLASFSLHRQVWKVRTTFKKILHIGDDAQNQDTYHWSLQATELEQKFINPMPCPLNYILRLWNSRYVSDFLSALPKILHPYGRNFCSSRIVQWSQIQGFLHVLKYMLNGLRTGRRSSTALQEFLYEKARHYCVWPLAQIQVYFPILFFCSK